MTALAAAIGLQWASGRYGWAAIIASPFPMLLWNFWLDGSYGDLLLCCCQYGGRHTTSDACLWSENIFWQPWDQLWVRMIWPVGCSNLGTHPPCPKRMGSNHSLTVSDAPLELLVGWLLRWFVALLLPIRRPPHDFRCLLMEWKYLLAALGPIIYIKIIFEKNNINLI